MVNPFKRLIEVVESFFARAKEDGGILSTLKKQKGFEVSTIEGESNFNDILAWFKTQNLDPKRHTPFIANFIELKDMFAGVDVKVSKPCAIIVGFIDEQADSITSIIIESDALDAKTKEVFGDEKLVVLQ